MTHNFYTVVGNKSPLTPQSSAATAAAAVLVPSPSARRKQPSPEHLYTNEMSNNLNNNNSSLAGATGRLSRTESISSLADSYHEEQLNELHQAAMVGKILLDSNARLRDELEQLKQDQAAKNKEIQWLKSNQVSKREYYDEIDQDRQEIQAKYDELTLDRHKLETELQRNRQALTFQEQRTAEVETQLKKELAWSQYYSQESAADASLAVNTSFNASILSQPDMSQTNYQIPSIAPIHQKMNLPKLHRSASDPDVSQSSRNLSADIACSQSRLNAEIDELHERYLEDLAIKQKEIQQLNIQLDEQRTLLARADCDKQDLEVEKQALIAQIQKPSVREIEAELTGNELYSVDAKIQQRRYDLARKKFDKILDSLEVEKQRIGTSSSFALSRSASMRISPNKGLSHHQKLQRFNSVRPGSMSVVRSSSSTSVTEMPSSETLDYSFEVKPRAHTISTVPQIPENQTPESTSTETTEPSSTPQSYSSVIDQKPIILQTTDVINVISDEEELNGEYCVEEPEYKKLFQELFELIHSVIPDD